MTTVCRHNRAVDAESYGKKQKIKESLVRKLSLVELNVVLQGAAWIRCLCHNFPELQNTGFYCNFLSILSLSSHQHQKQPTQQTQPHALSYYQTVFGLVLMKYTARRYVNVCLLAPVRSSRSACLLFCRRLALRWRLLGDTLMITLQFTVELVFANK